MIRKAAVSGQFYSGSAKGLMEQVSQLTEKVEVKTSAYGVVCPHAGFKYSGEVAGKVFSRIEMPDTFIIIGPNHWGAGAEFSIMTEGTWVNPVGEVKIDSLLAKEIFKNSRFLQEDPFSQNREHSLEVQVPFIQYFSDKTQIVPICLRHYEPDIGFLKVCEHMGSDISAVLKKVSTKVTLVASTDFTHYESQENAKIKDQAALDAILKLDPEKLFAQVREKDISMCGYAAVAVMLYAARDLGAKQAELVKYMTSGDTTGDYSQVVGYGGLIVT